jgi:hypothetical protein
MTVRAHKPEFNFREKLKELDGKLNKVDFPLTPSFRADLSSNQAIAHNTATKYAASTVHWDNFNGYNTTDYSYTIPIGGIYLITFMNWWAAGGGDRDIVFLDINGTNVARDYSYSPAGGTLSAEFVWNFRSGDVVTIRIQQSSGGSLTLDANNLNNGWTGTKIA